MTLKEFFKGDRFAVLAGCELTEIREGYARATMTVEERHLNGGDVCQGGAIFTLADLAFAAAATWCLLSAPAPTSVSSVQCLLALPSSQKPASW